MSARVGIVLGLAPLLIVAACSGPQARTLPPPSSTSSTDPTATVPEPDYSRVALEPIPGETTTTAPMTVGSSTLRGSVRGPDGPVPGAIVRADRLVGDAVQRTEVRTGEDGGYAITGIPGGRFRVRAFLPPTLAMESAEVFFLEDKAERELALTVRTFTGLAVRSGVTPSSPIVGQDVNLAVRVAQLTVDDDGVAREVPQAGAAVRVSASGWTRPADRSSGDDDDDDDDDEDEEDDDDTARRSRDDGVVRTDADGIAVFTFRCDRVTNVTATAFVGVEEQLFPLDPPPCRPVPTTTTTTTAPDDDDDDDDSRPSVTTSTTVR